MVRPGVVLVILAVCVAGFPVYEQKNVRRVRRDLEYVVNHPNMKSGINIHKRSILDAHQSAEHSNEVTHKTKNGVLKRSKRIRRESDDKQMQDYVKLLESQAALIYEKRMRREVPLQRFKRVKRGAALDRIQETQLLHHQRTRREIPLNRVKRETPLVRVKRGENELPLYKGKKSTPTVKVDNKGKPQFTAQIKPGDVKKDLTVLQHAIHKEPVMHEKTAPNNKAVTVIHTNNHNQKPQIMQKKSEKKRKSSAMTDQIPSSSKGHHMNQMVGAMINRIKKNGLQHQQGNHIRTKAEYQKYYKKNGMSHHARAKYNLEQKKKNVSALKHKQHKKTSTHGHHVQHSRGHTQHKKVHTHIKNIHSHTKPVHSQTKTVHPHTKPVHPHSKSLHPHSQITHTHAKPLHSHTKIVHQHNQRNSAEVHAHTPKHHEQQRENLKRKIAKINRLRREINKNVVQTIKQIKYMQSDRELHRMKRANNHNHKKVSYGHNRHGQIHNYKY